MSKAPFDRDNLHDPLLDGAELIARYIGDRCGSRVDYIHCEPNNYGLSVIARGEEDRRFLLVDRDRAGDGAPVLDRGVPGPLSALDLGRYVFDPLAEVGHDEQLYERFLYRGDLAVWLGREKHRKSNMILQFAISAAIGRDFVGLKFAAETPLKVVLIDFESKSASLKHRRESIIAAMALSHEERRLLSANLTIIEVRRIRKAGLVFPKFSHAPGAREPFWDELVARMPADLYIIDPLRSLHSADENDSTIEMLLSEMQRVFKGAAVIAAHHMRKAKENGVTLAHDMRAWSEGARGSSAIKAHSDVIVLQERTLNDKGEEIVNLGCFLKDGPDIEPFPLMESDHESFFWEVVTIVPTHLEGSYDALKAAGGRFKSKIAAAQEIITRVKLGRATAYRHIDTMLRLKLIADDEGRLTIQNLQS
jgi:hypothetical protein